MEEFKVAVSGAKNKFEAIKKVRLLLEEHFKEEIARLPKPQVVSAGILPPSSNDFKIATDIVEVLFGFENQA